MILAISIENRNTVRVSRHANTQKVRKAFHPLFNTDMGLITKNTDEALGQFSDSFRDSILSSEDSSNISTTLSDVVVARKLLGV